MTGIFADDLVDLVAREAGLGRHDPDRMADMIERLSAALGFTIAIACKGDPQAIDTMMQGAEAYAHSEAVAKSAILRRVA